MGVASYSVAEPIHAETSMNVRYIVGIILLALLIYFVVVYL